MVEELVFLFLVYAIIGWFWETPFVSIKEKKYINRGFLRGPYIPIYGFSCISIIIVLNALEFQQADTFFVILLQILIISLISVFWEFGTSWVLEKRVDFSGITKRIYAKFPRLISSKSIKEEKDNNEN